MKHFMHIIVCFVVLFEKKIARSLAAVGWLTGRASTV